MFYFAEDASDNPTFYADLTNPQSLNKYQYTYNNPLRYTDPDGHCPICIPIGRLIAVPAGREIAKVAAPVIAGAAAWAASKVDWKDITDGLTKIGARSGALETPSHIPQLVDNVIFNKKTDPNKPTSVEAEDVQPSKVPEATNAPALKGNPYSPQEVDKRRSDRRREMGTGNLDPNSPIPDQKPGKNIKGTHQADKKQHHATGERNVGTEEEHSRKAKGSHDLPRKP